MITLSEIKFEVVEVTPAIAALWLSKNFENNRTVNRSAILRFAEDMKAGLWKLTHQGIAFDEAGRLIDGQHRCRAVVLSGATVRMLVSWYTGASPLQKIDRGTARTVGDALEVSGEFRKGHGTAVAATLNAMSGLILGTTRGLSLEQVRAAYATHAAGVDAASALIRSKRMNAPFAGALAYVYPICPQRILSLFTQAIHNDSLAMHSGAWHLARIMAAGPVHDRPHRIEISRAAVKCTALHMQDREVKLFKVAVEGSFDGMNWAQAERRKLGLPIGLTA